MRAVIASAPSFQETMSLIVVVSISETLIFATTRNGSRKKTSSHAYGTAMTARRPPRPGLFIASAPPARGRSRSPMPSRLTSVARPAAARHLQVIDGEAAEVGDLLDRAVGAVDAAPRCRRRPQRVAPDADLLGPE